MGTAVLRSQDCLKNRLPSDTFRSSTPTRPKPGRNTTTMSPHGRTTPPQAKPYRNGNSTPAGRSSPSQAKRSGNNNNNTPARSRRRSRTGEDPGPHRMVVKLPVKNLVMEEVTILKRGEEPKPKSTAGGLRRSDPEGKSVETDGGDDLPLCTVDRLGTLRRSDLEEKPVGTDGGDDLVFCSADSLCPDPEILPKRIGLMDLGSTVYAGSCFVTSPPPSSLPLPTSFFAKKAVENTTDLATRKILNLLQLDLP